MDLFTRRDLDDLLAVRDGPCVSMFLPTHRAAPETAQGPIRFKNTLRQVNGQLEQRGLISRELREQLGELRSWLEDSGFWRHQRDGVVVFFASTVHRRYRLPELVRAQFLIKDDF